MISFAPQDSSQATSRLHAESKLSLNFYPLTHSLTSRQVDSQVVVDVAQAPAYSHIARLGLRSLSLYSLAEQKRSDFIFCLSRHSARLFHTCVALSACRPSGWDSQISTLW